MLENIQSKADIKSMTVTELEQFVLALGEQKFRAAQLYSWLHKKQVTDFDAMTNFSATLKNKLSEHSYISRVQTHKKLCSKLDETKKFLMKLIDDNCVETVLMSYRHAFSLCISTQVGCKMGCEFCASTKAGFVRNLTAAEMLEQVYEVERTENVHIGSIVLMGIGEPLDNYDNVLKFLNIISSDAGKNLSMRHISLSTCGVVHNIDRLAEEKTGVTLSISLHATDDATRDKIMPINKTYNIERLLSSCKSYFKKTGRRISFEYALIHGENDSVEQAKALAKLLKGMNCHVNLIPINKIEEKSYTRSGEKQVGRFKAVLLDYNINTTVRRELGKDIDAACGQLRLNSETEVML